MFRFISKLFLVISLWFSLITIPSAIYIPSTPMKCTLERVEKAVESYSTDVDVSSCRLNIDEMKTYFWDGAAGYRFRELISSFTFRYSTDVVDSLTIQYRYSKDSTIQIQQDYEVLVEELLDSIDSSMSTLDKMFYVYNYLALHTQYDVEAAEVENSFQDPKYALAFSVFGPLYYKKSVCSGYSQGYLDILRRLGIESYYLTSDAMNHGWNFVKYFDHFYHVDITYGDPVPDIKGYVDYSYFMMNDSEISKDHSWEDTTAVSDSVLMSDSKYIFNQDIKDAHYANGKWYYVEKGNIYSSTIDSFNKVLEISGSNILDLYIVGDRMYYTTTNTGYYINSIYETTLDKAYTVQLTTLKNSTYIEGLFVDDGYAYVNTRNKEVHKFHVGGEATLESYLESIEVVDGVMSGEIVLTVQYYNTLFTPSEEAELLLVGKKYTLGIPLVERGDSLYSFSIALEDLFNETYQFKIEYGGQKYPFTSVLSDEYEYQDINGASVAYKVGELVVEGIADKVADLDLSYYSALNMDVYENSRVTSITSTDTGFSVAGYLFEKNANCDKETSVWREIVFVNEADSSPEYAYRKQVTPVYKTWLNSNMNATANGKYKLNYAEYVVDFSLTGMNHYLTNTNAPVMKPGSYLVYMRISNGKTSQLFPLKDVTLSDGTNMENSGTLPNGFEIVEYENRTLRYIVK